MPPKSNIWKYFVKCKDQAGAMCIECDKFIKTTGNTTNLHSHLRRNHPDIKIATAGAEKESITNKKQIQEKEENNLCDKDLEIPDEVSSTSSTVQVPQVVPQQTSKTKSFQFRIDNLLATQRSFEVGGIKYDGAIKRLVYMIAKDKLPISIVEKDGFKEFCKYINPSFKCPCRKNMSKEINECYERLSASIKNKLTTIEYIALTADIWTDGNTCRSYLGISTHFIDQKYESISIGVKELDDRHTAENIEIWFNEILVEWKIRKEQIAIVVGDQGANIKKAIIDCFGKEKYLECFAHVLNLIPAEVFENDLLKPLIDQIKKIVGFFHHSVRASDLLRNVTKLVLLNCNNTRWGSVLKMMERYIELADEISNILLVKLHGDTKLEPLLGEELQTIKEIVNFLQPIHIATEIFSGEKYITGSECIPLIKNLKNQLDCLTATTTTSIEFKKLLLNCFDKRFKHIENKTPIAAATLLDPRYKKMYFNNSTACSAAINYIAHSMISISKDNSKELGALKENTKTETHINNNNHSNENNDKMWSLDKQLRERIQLEKMKSIENKIGIPADLSYYLNEDPIAKEEDPIKYWLNLPKSSLTRIALKQLTIIATSVPVERLFSHAKCILSDKRNQLSPHNFQTLLFLSMLNKKYYQI